MNIFTTIKSAAFLGGAVVGAVGMQALQSDVLRKVAVSGIAKGIILKDAVVEQMTNLKEEAEDIYAEAQEKAKESTTGDFNFEDGFEVNCDHDIFGEDSPFEEGVDVDFTQDIEHEGDFL